MLPCQFVDWKRYKFEKNKKKWWKKIDIFFPFDLFGVPTCRSPSPASLTKRQWPSIQWRCWPKASSVDCRRSWFEAWKFTLKPILLNPYYRLNIFTQMISSPQCELTKFANIVSRATAEYKSAIGGHRLGGNQLGNCQMLAFDCSFLNCFLKLPSSKLIRWDSGIFCQTP